MAAWGRAPQPWAERLPIPRTLNRFLAEAQDVVNLRGQVSVLLTTNRAMRSLNRRFRRINKATDVLSFPADPIPGIRATDIHVGDLAISVEIARQQAAEQGHALTCELKILILHGLLHLAGYDHETDNGRMACRERQLRAMLGLPQGLIERSEKEGFIKGDGLQPVRRRRNRLSALAASGMVREPLNRPSEAKASLTRNGQTYGLKPALSTGPKPALSAGLKPVPSLPPTLAETRRQAESSRLSSPVRRSRKP
jgi:probable rRNA maturation factor